MHVCTRFPVVFGAGAQIADMTLHQPDHTRLADAHPASERHLNARAFAGPELPNPQPLHQPPNRNSTRFTRTADGLETATP